MKKVLIIAAIAGTALTTNAQFTKGDKFTSSSLGYSSSTMGDWKSSSFSLAPSVGYFVSDNLSIGVGIGIGSNSSEDLNPANNKVEKYEDVSSFSFGAHANYFFTPAEKFSFFANIGFDYTSKNNKIATDLMPKATYSGFGLSVVPSVSYFLNNRLAMQASYGSVGYNTMKSDAAGAKSENNLGVNLDMSSIGFGLTYKF